MVARQLAVGDNIARFLQMCQLHLGSPTQYNAEERQSAPRWFQLCFLRFYHYDILRSLEALLQWSYLRDRRPNPA